MPEIHKDSLSDSVVKEILKFIKEGAIKPGDRLPTMQNMSKTFKIGLSSVREGLQKLYSMGIIEIHQGRGTYITDKIDLDAISANIENLLLLEKPYLSQLIEARRLIECETARLAAERASDDQIVRIGQILKVMKLYAGNNKKFAIEDVNFHILLAECSRNIIYTIFLKSIRGMLKEEVESVLRLPGATERALKYHESIYQAIKTRSTDVAIQKMREHLLDIERAIEKETIKRRKR